MQYQKAKGTIKLASRQKRASFFVVSLRGHNIPTLRFVQNINIPGQNEWGYMDELI